MTVKEIQVHGETLNYAVVTPLRIAASYEPRIALLGNWSDTWLTSDISTWQYVVVTGPLRALTGAT